MIEWLREKVEEWYATGEPERAYCGIPYAFIDWLEATGASPLVRVEDALPEHGQLVLAVFQDSLAAMFNGAHYGIWKYDSQQVWKDATHWMALPRV